MRCKRVGMAIVGASRSGAERGGTRKPGERARNRNGAERKLDATTPTELGASAREL